MLQPAGYTGKKHFILKSIIQEDRPRLPEPCIVPNISSSFRGHSISCYFRGQSKILLHIFEFFYGLLISFRIIHIA